MNKAFLLALCALGLAGAPVVPEACAQAAQPPPAPLSVQTAPTPLARTELYFGKIAPEQWDEFLAQVVTPRFPDGLTWFDTHGQWQNRTGIVTRQDSRVLILIHAPTPEKDRLIDEVRTEFKTRYKEQSVLRATQAVTASF